MSADPHHHEELSSARTPRDVSDELTPPAAHLRDHLRILVRRRGVVLTAMLAIGLLTGVYTLTRTPMFEGRAQILIDVDDPTVVEFTEVVDERPTRQDYFLTQHRLIQSRRVARKAIGALGLWKRTSAASEPAPRFSVGHALEWAASWLQSNPPETVAAGAPSGPENPQEARVVDRFLAGLSVRPVRNSRLVDVVYRAADPRLAAEAANAVATAYIEQHLEFRFNTTRDASSWLEGQLAQQRQAVAAAEARLQAYRERHESVSFEQSDNIVVQKLSDLNAALTKAKTERLQKEAAYVQLRAVQEDPRKVELFPSILASEFIQQQKSTLAQLKREQVELSQRLGDRHPDMIKVRTAIETVDARIRSEIGELVQAVQIEYQTALAQEQSLSAALDGQRGQALQMNRMAIGYSALLRDVESGKQIYEALLRRGLELGVSGQIKTSNVRVVDAAEVPTRPVWPRPGLSVLLGIFAGLAFGIGLAFFFEYMDDRMKTPDDIESHLGLASIGLIPEIKGRQAGASMLGARAPARMVEAFAVLRTNVIFSRTQSGSASIVVTSTGPREGKTLVASNLAVAMAQADRRVVLIDADMRRPRAHEVFDLSAEPGLSNVIVGANTLAESLRQTPDYPNLWVLPAGRVPPNPAELLGSKRCTDLIDSLKREFDLILIDTPPVMSVTDAAVLAHGASGVLFVVAADETSRHLAHDALAQLTRTRGRFVGAVLNRVDLDRHAYYYSRYYRKDYATYYDIEAAR